MQHDCPECKVIIDSIGALPSAAYLLADTVGHNHPLFAPARFLARTADKDATAILRAVDMGRLSPEQIDEAHAWSELNCHRAAAIRSWVDDMQLAEPGEAAKLLREWAEQDRLFTTKLIGGEYSGAWVVEGVQGISRKK